MQKEVFDIINAGLKKRIRDRSFYIRDHLYDSANILSIFPFGTMLYELNAANGWQVCGVEISVNGLFYTIISDVNSNEEKVIPESDIGIKYFFTPDEALEGKPNL